MVMKQKERDREGPWTRVKRARRIDLMFEAEVNLSRELRLLKHQVTGIGLLLSA